MLGGSGWLRAFRSDCYGCLTRWADALFELADALGWAERVASPPVLSLNLLFGCGWGSVYATLARGWVDEQAVRQVLVAHRPVSWP